MTAEERLEYFNGQKSRSYGRNYGREHSSGNGAAWLKLKFLVTLILFTLFLSMDYTGEKIQGIGSSDISQMVAKDFSYRDFSYKELLSRVSAYISVRGR